MKGVIKELLLLQYPAAKFIMFEQARMKLCEEMADKGPDGKPIINKLPDGDEFQVTNKEEFEKKLNELREKHKEGIKEQEERNKKYHSAMNEEVEIDFYVIHEESLPEDLSPKQLRSLLVFVDGPQTQALKEELESKEEKNGDTKTKG